MRTKQAVGPSNQLYVLNPFLELVTSAEHVELQLPYYGIKIHSRTRVKAALDRFFKPQTLQSALTAGMESDLLTLLVHNFVLLPVNEVHFLGRGLLCKGYPEVGTAVSWSDLATNKYVGGTGLFSVAMDFSQTVTNRRRSGPQQVREALGPYFGDLSQEGIVDCEFRTRITSRELKLYDLGDVAYEPGEDTVLDVGCRVRKIARKLLDCKIRPFAIGSDHTLTYFVLEEILTVHRKVGVIHFDAHTDMYGQPYRSWRGVNHANMLRHLRRHRGLQVLLQLGLRDAFCPAKNWKRENDKRIRCLSSLELQTVRTEGIFERLPRDIPYYLSFDVDVLDPSVAPETGCPVPGGLSYYQALSLLTAASTTLNIVGADFCEVAGSETVRNSAAEIVARFIATLIIRSGRKKTAGSYVYEPNSN